MGLRRRSAKLFSKTGICRFRGGMKALVSPRMGGTVVRTAWRGEGCCSIEATLRDLVLIPAQVVAELMEVGQPHFIAVNGLISLGIVPEVFEEKQDLGRQGCALGEFSPVLMADEQTEDIRFPPLGLKRGVRVLEIGRL